MTDVDAAVTAAPTMTAVAKKSSTGINNNQLLASTPDAKHETGATQGFGKESGGHQAGSSIRRG